VRVVRYPYFYPISFEILTSGSGILHVARHHVLGKIQIVTFLISQFFGAVYLCSKNKFDVIHVHWIIPQGVIGVLIKFIWGIPVVVTVHGTDVFALKRLSWFKRFVLNHCTVCTVNSNETKRAVRLLSSTVTIHKIPMGVDTTLFKKSHNEENYNRNNPTLLGVGRLIKWKGFSVLIDAVSLLHKKYPNMKVKIVGTGPWKNDLKLQAREQGISKTVGLLGARSRRDVARLYAKSDLFILPSITDEVSGEREAQGVVLLEAFACGVPIVASRSGGIPDTIIHGKTGLLAREKDPKDLARQIDKMLRDEKLRQTCITNGFKEVTKYSWKLISSKFAQIYTGIINNQVV
jgi:glycosyltransferase involved in cell wall biosynthesis